MVKTLLWLNTFVAKTKAFAFIGLALRHQSPPLKLVSEMPPFVHSTLFSLSGSLKLETPLIGLH